MQRQFSLVFFALLIAGALVVLPPAGAVSARSFGETLQPGGWAPQTSETANELRTVHFINVNEGWAAGANATLLRTTNGGGAWTPVITGAEAARGFKTVRFLDQNTGWAGGASVVARTMNAGTSWSVAVLPSTNQISNNVLHNSFFPLSATAVWTGGEGVSQSTGNPVGTEILYDLSAGNLLTTQANISFSITGQTRIVSDVHFFDMRVGWAIGNAGFIAKTDLNQANPFTFHSVATTQQLNAIQMLNASTGWVVGNGGVIFKTTNGAAWTPLTSGTTANLREVYFVDANRGWAVGDGGVILTTGDGGGVWTPETSGVTADLRGVFFASAGVGYAVGANGTILKRTVTTGGAVVTTVSAASFTGGLLAPDSIAAAFGTALATTTQAATGLPLPTTLAGTTVKVRDSVGAERNASLFFVSPDQVNFLIPTGTAAGTANVTVTNGQGGTNTGTISIAAVAPGLFTANSSGAGVAAAVALRIRADGSQSFEPVSRFDAALNRFVSVPIALGPATDQVFLLFYGTGLRNRSALTGVTATIGGTNSEVLFVGAQPDFVGLDQINVRVARSLAGRGEVDVVLTADGRTANTVQINIGAASGTSAPVIANLTLNNPTMNGTTATISGRLDFTDSDGDIVFNGNIANSAYVRFQVIFGQAGCTGGVTGIFLHFPGQTSGSINFGGSYTFTNPILQPISVQIRLLDVAGNASNALTASVNQWFCGLPMDFEWRPGMDWSVEPAWSAWMLHARRRELAG